MSHVINSEKNSWQGVCLVGLGNHAQTKIIPALKLSGKEISAVVSRKNNDKINLYRNFSDLDNALTNLPSSTLFILTTPPSEHFDQALKILNSGFDVMIEKPGILSIDNLELLKAVADKNKLVLIEMLMYLENKTAQDLKKIILQNLNKIIEINSTFLIPDIPKNTFRDEFSLERSLLSDIGCYPLSFLSFCGIPLQTISARRLNQQNKLLPTFNLFGKFQQIKLNSLVGCAQNYENFIQVIYNNNSSIKYSPFFYGRKGEKKIILESRNKIIEKGVIESNGFELMFKKNRSEWLATQKIRFEMMRPVAEAFTRFYSEISFY